MRCSFSGCGSRTYNLTEGEVVSDFVTVANRLGDEIFPDLHRVRQVVAERERGTNRSGISAAGAMRENAFDERRGEQQLRFTVKKNVNGLTAIFQMPAFHQCRAAVTQNNCSRGGAQVFR